MTEFGEREIPSGTYLVIFSPVPRLHNGRSHDGKADDAIKVCRGLVTAALGHAAAEAAIYTCDSHLHEVRTSVSADVIENFVSVKEYSYLDPKTLADLANAASTHIPAPLRERFETAMLLIGSATAVVDSTTRLMHTWIALEVACGSRGKAEEAIRMTTDGDNAPYHRIKTARDALFHDGKRTTLFNGRRACSSRGVVQRLLGQYRLPLKAVQPIPGG